MEGSSRAVLAGLLVAAAACTKPAAKVDKEAPPATTASAAVAAPAAVVSAPRTIPTFTLEPFAPGGVKPSALFPIEGALAVVDDQRVGRIDGDSIAWIGHIPSTDKYQGHNRIQYVAGYWPDGVGALYVSAQDRAPEPTYWPVAGKGGKLSTGEGGTRGNIYGIVHIGESTVGVWDTYYGPPKVTTLKGPARNYTFTSGKDAGCKPGEVSTPDAPEEGIAVEPYGLAGTPGGALISLGELCRRSNTPVAEIWDKGPKGRIVALTRLWRSSHYRPAVARGAGEEVFFHGGPWEPVLRYHDGQFEALPTLPGPTEDIFSSPSGQLHAFDGQVIFRWEGGKWTPLGRVAERKERNLYPLLAVDDKGDFWLSDHGVFRLRKAPGAEGPAPPDEATCQDWFVYLYVVNFRTEPQYTFPTTRKALQSFPDGAALSLVDIQASRWVRHLGVTASSKAQAEAVAAHVRATMKDEDPRVFCYKPPPGARRLDLEGKAIK